MKSENKNLLFFLTGKLSGYISHNLIVGNNLAANEFMFHRFGDHEDATDVLLMHKTLEDIRVTQGIHYCESEKDLKDKYSLITFPFSLASLAEDGYSLDDVAIFCDGKNARNIIITYYDEDPDVDKGSLIEVLQMHGFSLEAQGKIVRKDKLSFPKFTGKSLVGCLFVKQRGK